MRATDARQLVSLYGTLGAILGGTAAVYRTRWRANVASPGGGSCFCNFIYFDAPLQVAMPDGSYLVTPVWFRIPWPFPARAPTGRTDLPQGRTPAAG